jgi:ABC-type multidrug transport system fused ATPase/permease subunit
LLIILTPGIESEKLVQAAFERASKGRTTVAVAHRLATIQGADIIYVLGEGKVLEKGTHSELLKKKGVYWHMVRRDPNRRYDFWLT